MYKPGGFRLGGLQATADILVTGGSETSVTGLTATIYFLLKHPSKLQMLTHEIRNQFRNESEISMVAVNNLTYLGAVLEESLRLFPAAVGVGVRLTTAGTTICKKVRPSRRCRRNSCICCESFATQLPRSRGIRSGTLTRRS
jgi:cytochrome P450